MSRERASLRLLLRLVLPLGDGLDAMVKSLVRRVVSVVGWRKKRGVCIVMISTRTINTGMYQVPT